MCFTTVKKKEEKEKIQNILKKKGGVQRYLGEKDKAHLPHSKTTGHIST